MYHVNRCVDIIFVSQFFLPNTSYLKPLISKLHLSEHFYFVLEKTLSNTQYSKRIKKIMQNTKIVNKIILTF